MSTELTVLAWGCVLGILEIIIAAQSGIAQYGWGWGMSSREAATPPPKPVVGRIGRASKNFLETFPIAAAAVLIVQVGGLNSRWTAMGAVVWLAARVAHWVLYTLGITVLRTLAYLVSLAGIGMMLWPALH